MNIVTLSGDSWRPAAEPQDFRTKFVESDLVGLYEQMEYLARDSAFYTYTDEQRHPLGEEQAAQMIAYMHGFESFDALAAYARQNSDPEPSDFQLSVEAVEARHNRLIARLMVALRPLGLSDDSTARYWYWRYLRIQWPEQTDTFFLYQSNGEESLDLLLAHPASGRVVNVESRLNSYSWRSPGPADPYRCMATDVMDIAWMDSAENLGQHAYAARMLKGAQQVTDWDGLHRFQAKPDKEKLRKELTHEVPPEELDEAVEDIHQTLLDEYNAAKRYFTYHKVAEYRNGRVAICNGATDLDSFSYMAGSYLGGLVGCCGSQHWSLPHFRTEVEEGSTDMLTLDQTNYNSPEYFANLTADTIKQLLSKRLPFRLEGETLQSFTHRNDALLMALLRCRLETEEDSEMLHSTSVWPARVDALGWQRVAFHTPEGYWNELMGLEDFLQQARAISLLNDADGLEMQTIRMEHLSLSGYFFYADIPGRNERMWFACCEFKVDLSERHVREFLANLDARSALLLYFNLGAVVLSDDGTLAFHEQKRDLSDDPEFRPFVNNSHGLLLLRDGYWWIHDKWTNQLLQELSGNPYLTQLQLFKAGEGAAFTMANCRIAAGDVAACKRKIYDALDAALADPAPEVVDAIRRHVGKRIADHWRHEPVDVQLDMNCQLRMCSISKEP